MTTEPTPDVVVIVGTDHHPFDRLIQWMDDWLASTAPGSIRCLVQYGTSKPPMVADGRGYLDHSEVQTLMRGARAVVSHGGPTTIAEARRAGHQPVVVARDPECGEHVDGHQMRFARRLAAIGGIHLVENRAELDSALESRLRTPRSTEPLPGADTTASALRFAVLVEEILDGCGRG
ncbi:MAG TPA: glycosyltransferase [Marmoricola sp.]|nr:glycosyltransferase [Marmoricola sp.]